MHTKRDIENLIRSLYRLVSDKIKVDGIYLFGSYAKGNPREESDIDIAILSEDFEGVRLNDRSMISKIIIRETFPNLVFTDIEIHPYKTEDFTKDDPFVAEILRTGIRII